MAFDLLALDDELLLDEPYELRRERLSTFQKGNESIVVSPYEVALDADAGAVNANFEAARARGNEGLMLKRLDSPYAPGRRGKWWIKLKRELSTLDVAVVAVEWGHGKRSKVLSDYTFAVRGDDGELVAIGKAYSGLTDAEIAELTPWFLEHRLPRERRREKARSSEIPVEPQIVLEVAFDVIHVSNLHESGFALRFPRIVRIRDDKPPQKLTPCIAFARFTKSSCGASESDRATKQKARTFAGLFGVHGLPYSGWPSSLLPRMNGRRSGSGGSPRDSSSSWNFSKV